MWSGTWSSVDHSLQFAMGKRTPPAQPDLSHSRNGPRACAHLRLRAHHEDRERTFYSVSFVADGPTQPPSPASCAKAILFLGPTSVGSLQPLGYFGGSALLFGSSLGLPVSSSTLVHLGPSTSRLHLGFLLPRLQLGPLSLRLHRLLRPSGSTLVSRRSAYITDSTPLVQSDFSFPLALPWSSIPPALPQSFG
ncbi:hypothetical protein DPX16_5377 [Anabarilius grahami]|uniref:Uncharacterized protein n=1 Tax=Anabarilius grahami TaxID=495550 RepID=A0A3N0Y680_ANAGA|nr:hypothetical protein DPX16_5377 [Anabarilius grahami]